MNQLKRVLALVVALVLTIVMVPTTNVSAATKSQKKSYNKVVKYLKNYGDKYGKTYVIENGSYSISTQGGKVIQLHYYDGDIAVNVFIKKKSMNKITIKESYLQSSPLTTWEASKTMKAMKYSNKNYRIKYKISDLFNTDRSTANYYTNRHVNSMMKQINKWLKADIGVSLKNLGMRNCK